MASTEERSNRPKVVVVMPAYNAAKTLKITYEVIPHKTVDQVVLVDDGSTDQTLEIAWELNLTAFMHARNFAFVDSSIYGLSILFLLSGSFFRR